jgi:hypothetical protein
MISRAVIALMVVFMEKSKGSSFEESSGRAEGKAKV